MTNPLDLIRNQQAQNRSRHAESQQQREKSEQRRSQQWKYVGFNADSGKGIVQGSDGGSAEAKPVTNGFVKAGQAVRFDEAGQQAQFDAMPFPKTTEEETTTQTGDSLKILSGLTDDDGALKFFVSHVKGGRFTFNPEPILIVPQGEYAESFGDQTRRGTAFIARAQINNTGAGPNDWVAGISYILQGVTSGLFTLQDPVAVPGRESISDAIGVINSITPKKNWQLRTDIDRRASTFFPAAVELVFSSDVSYKGFGFWAGTRYYITSNTELGVFGEYANFSWLDGELTEGRFVLPQVTSSDYQSLICNSELKTAIAASQNNLAIITKNSTRNLSSPAPSNLDFSPFSGNRRNFISFVGDKIHDCEQIKQNRKSFEIRTYQVLKSEITFRSKKTFRASIRLPANHKLFRAHF
jgi:hypothetical protein